MIALFFESFSEVPDGQAERTMIIDQRANGCFQCCPIVPGVLFI